MADGFVLSVWPWMADRAHAISVSIMVDRALVQRQDDEKGVIV